MTNARLNYLLSNGTACEKFLGDFADGRLVELNRNMVVNHGLAVHALLVELERCELEKRMLHQQIDQLVKELRMLKADKLDPLLEKSFEALKDSLITYIEEY